ncbi:MAG: glycosyltransferase [Planctomycetota bacterium]|jgi:glycosyltransferase involved in cell wall biosynthesis
MADYFTSDTPYLGPIDQDQSNVDRSLLLFGGWKNGVCKPIEDKEEIMRIIKKNNEKLQNAIKRFSPQLCLLGNIDFLSHSILQPLLKSGIPVIHHFGSTNPGYSVADTPKEELYIPAAASGWLKEQIVQQGYTFADFRVIYPGALVKQFKMNILPDMDKLRIAYASIVLPYKGPHILINALKKLHDMGIDFSCSLAGTSTDEKFVNSLKNFVTQTGMDEKVTFVGFLPRENLKNFLARHNVLAFPSLVCEAFGISQVEAMAAGLTVVTSGTGGAKEIIEHGLSGVIFNSGDHESLARELLQLTEDKERWRQIALAGQKRALQSFDIEKSVDDIERIYCHLTQHDENGIEHGRKIHSLYERDIVGKKNSTPHISATSLHTNDSNPLVSIIMPAYNAAEYIAEAIESVLIQNYRNFELIIVDDGSTDNTKDIIAGFKDEKIKYFYKENAGAASARNLAMKESKGDFLITLDADDMITPDFITKHLQQFEKHPKTDLVYCDDYLIDEDGKPTQVSERPEYPDRKSLIKDLFRYGCSIVPFRTCIRKSVFDKIGIFDEDLLVGEDYDMMRRFVKSGLKIHHLKDALYLRRITPNNLLRNSTAQNAKCHFEVVKRFTDTFAYDELFPDVSWDQIPPQMRQLHAKCLAAATYVAIGHAYIESNSPAYADRASKLACSELNDCLKIDPNNRQIRQLLQKYELLQAKWAEESPTSYSIGKHKINN